MGVWCMSLRVFGYERVWMYGFGFEVYGFVNVIVYGYVDMSV